MSKCVRFGANTALKLRYTLPALADLESILNYIAAHSPQGTDRVKARIQAIIDSFRFIL
jgi:plasmid stabilization system protein ParE